MYDVISNLINGMVSIIFWIAKGIGSDAIISFTGNQSDYANLWTFFTSVAENVAVPAGVILVVIYFVISLSERASTDKITFEMYLREIIKLCFGLYLVTNAVDIAVGVIEIGNGILSAAEGYLGDLSGVSGEFWDDPWVNFVTADAAREMGILGSALMVVLLILFVIIQIIFNILMKAIFIMRLIDISSRTAFAPIALADSFTGNFMNTHAVNYLRGLGSLCLQGVILTALALAYPAILGGIIGQTFELPSTMLAAIGALGGPFIVILKFVEMLAASIACLVFMFKSGSVAKEILGAR